MAQIVMTTCEILGGMPSLARSQKRRTKLVTRLYKLYFEINHKIDT